MSTADVGAQSPTFQARALRLLRSDAAIILLLFVVSRVAILSLGYWSLRNFPSPHNGDSLLPDFLVRWDSHWYLGIAQSGYDAGESIKSPGATRLAFYPIYPALMWVVGWASGIGPAAAGVVVSNACFLAALYAIYAFGKTIGNRIEAMLSVALICVVPESVIFSAVYTESLFVMLTAVSMLAFRRQHYIAASLASGLNSAVRSNGVLIVIWFGLDIVARRGWKGTLRFWEQPEEYLPLVAAPFGLVAWWWFCFIATGDAFAQKSTVVHGWGWRPALPWDAIMTPLLQGDLQDRLWVGSMLVAIACSLLLLTRRSGWPLFGYVIANLALYLTGTLSNSLLRYAISIFPIYYGLAWAIARYRPAGAVLFFVFVSVSAAVVVAWAMEWVFVL